MHYFSILLSEFPLIFFEGNWTTMNFWSPQKMLHSILFLFLMQREDQRLQCKKYGSQVKSVNALPLFKTLIPAFLALALFHSESNPFHLAATFIAKFLQHAICRYWFLQSKGQLGEPFLDRAQGHSHILFPILKTCPLKNKRKYYFQLLICGSSIIMWNTFWNDFCGIDQWKCKLCNLWRISEIPITI